jgi:hypothetical protein
VNARNHLAVLVKRYLNDALSNIESVSTGVFPALRSSIGKSSVKKNDT